jgi:integrase
MGKGMARRRLATNRGLEKYVKIDARGYVAYLHPSMKAEGQKAIRFGKDIDKANRFARAFVRILDEAEDLNTTAARIVGGIGPDKTLKAVIAEFKLHYIPQRVWSPGYTSEIKIRLDKVAGNIGNQAFRTLDVLALKQTIYSLFNGDGIRQAKNALEHVYKYAIGEGYCDPINLAALINIPKRKGRQRERVKDREEYNAKRDKCPAWLQDAADLAVMTLLRRSDLVSIHIKRDIVRLDDVRVIRKVHKKTGYAAEIVIDEHLAPIVNRCIERAMKLGCPHLICTPQRDTSITRKAKTHRAQVLPGYLTDKWKEFTGSQFHELRSLGERMMRQAGYTPEQIRALGGWTTEKMRQLYDDDDQVQWIRAQPGKISSK